MSTKLVSAPSRATSRLTFQSLRTVTSPEDQAANRRRYCGIASAEQLFGLSTHENVRGYLGEDHKGEKRKSTLVNLAIRRTLDENRDLFATLNSGLVIVARHAHADDKTRILELTGASIINGAQTQGVLTDYFEERSEDKEFPSVSFEVIVTDDEELIADISIARNFQNRVNDLSIYGRHGLFDELERRMQASDPDVRLRKSETDFDPDQVDTEKLIQVLTALTPSAVRLPSAEKRKVKTPETIYRVYAYRHRSRCLKDFAEVMQSPEEWAEAYEFFLEIAAQAWELYHRLRSEQSFSNLQKVEGSYVSGKKVVTLVPDGIVFPMISALSRFTKKTRNGWKFSVPASFPWPTLFRQASTQFKTTAGHNPQSMGKEADCYVALHGAIDMYFDVVKAN